MSDELIRWRRLALLAFFTCIVLAFALLVRR